LRVAVLAVVIFVGDLIAIFGVHVALVILGVTNLAIVVMFLISNLLLATGVEILTTFGVFVMGLTVGIVVLTIRIVVVVISIGPSSVPIILAIRIVVTLAIAILVISLVATVLVIVSILMPVLAIIPRILNMPHPVPIEKSSWEVPICVLWSQSRHVWHHPHKWHPAHAAHHSRHVHHPTHVAKVHHRIEHAHPHRAETILHSIETIIHSIIIQIIEILRVPEILVEFLRAAIVGLVVSRTINNLIGSIIGGALTSGVDIGAIIGWSI
jgi:hypothetical protein